MTQEQIAPCKCGHHAGWFEKRCVSYEQYFDETGEATHASDILAASRGGVRKYCCECSRDITRLIKDRP